MKANQQDHMKKLLQKAVKPLVTPFKAKYEVVCTTYLVIPGLPVNKNESKHKFERGAALEAREFYAKVVSSEMTRTMAPVEVQLRKIYLGGKTIERAEFGPVAQLRQVVNGKKK
jgi:hypothetical protein